MRIGELRELIPAFLDAVSGRLESADLEQRLTQVHLVGFQQLADKMLGQRLEPGQHGLGFAVQALALCFHDVARFLVHFVAAAWFTGRAHRS